MVAAPIPLLRSVRLAGAGEPERRPLDETEGLPRGRLIELAAGPDAARTSAAIQILLASQREGDPVAWIQPRGGSFFPPDAVAAGLDLGALLVVHVPPEAGPAGPPKAAELILRTGAFGAIAIDLATARAPRGDAWLSRLASLARDHDCRCLFLTDGAAHDRSLGSLVALRLLARRRRTRPGRFRLELEVLKDKRGLGRGGLRLPGADDWSGPEGMP